MAAAPAKEVTTRQVTAVRFGFYTEDEVRKLSVVKITSPIIFDNMKVAVADGLYDPRMGPVDVRDRCGTCQLGFDRCPGHFGHIELPVPVYNPMVFKVLYKLMRCTCFQCHRLKLAQQTVEVYKAKLQRLAVGDLVDAVEINTDLVSKSKELAEFMSSADPEKQQAKLASLKPVTKPAARHITQHSLEAMRDTISELLSKMNSKRCQNCKVHNPDVKKQGAMKLFCVWSSRKALLENAQGGVSLHNVMDDVVGQLERQLKSELVKKSTNLKRARTTDGDSDDEEAEKKVPEDAGAYGSVADFEDDKAIDVDGKKRTKREPRDQDEEEYDEVERGGSGGGGGDYAAEDGKGAAVDGKELIAGTGRKGKGGTKGPGVQPTIDVATKYMTPLEVEEHLRLLWQNEWPVLSLIYSAHVAPTPGKRVGSRLMTEAEARQAYRMFFLRVIAVPPNKFRPPSKVGEELFEHAHNVSLSKIISSCLDLTSAPSATEATRQGTNATGANPEQVAALDLSRRVAIWLQLQDHVCTLMDLTTAESKGANVPGIRQSLEKKEGLFRKNMMGKRVNFAARSVISPDPYIGAGEIGVPPYFAKRLSFPERVTPLNVERLRAAVIVGAEAHPGAVAVEEVSSGRMISLGNMPLQRRQALAKQLLSNTAVLGRTAPLSTRLGGGAACGQAAVTYGGCSSLPGNYIVYRHLHDGDLMLTNRQPTLHKPGLMAHRARVLKGERTIRMHYANCSTFNADFDGDEINLHLPQDQLGRSEGYVIVHADQQYIVPTDGKPIRGLIQDHVGSGTLITKRGTWFTADEYRQLVYVACTPWNAKNAAAAAVAAAAEATGIARAKVTVTSLGRAADIKLEPPCMLKPRRLWSGKQVISTVVSYFTRGLPPLTFSAGGKVPASYWGNTSMEHELEFFRGAMVRGVVDKNSFGKYGLVHAVQELYGNVTAGEILSAFSRLFTYYLQWHGFSCGMDDLLLVPKSEAKREALLASAEARAVQASSGLLRDKDKAQDSVELPEKILADPTSHARELLKYEMKVAAALGERYRANRDTGKAHDMKGSGAMHALSSEVIKVCLPDGQVKAFPKNCLSLMTITGAKGSLVNFSQISCLLGQQELEGRRPPRMASGKTLPCFRPYDGGGRSNGFIGDRFLTGLRPQEYYFHCMAGREGLVDTAVKTSRSGYLQRCLIKNLESLRVHYDGTVRDNCDASIVQLAYGEDGLDVMNVSYMLQFGFLARNAERFVQQVDQDTAMTASKVACLTEREAKVAAALEKRGKLLEKASQQEKEGQAEAAAESRKRAAALLDGMPISALHPPTVVGASSEAFADALQAFMRANAGSDLLAADVKSATKSKRDKQHQAKAPNILPGRVDGATFSQLMMLKFMRSLAAAGEAVGVLAAQSIGEPSTQMTLNTFHMAGRGEANVTLGIPRLREILMTAAKRIKTPVMTLPVRRGMAAAEAQVLANRMRRLRLAECLSGITVEERPVAHVPALGGGYGRVYRVTLHFFSPSQYPPETALSFVELVRVFRGLFSKRLQFEVEKETRRTVGVGIGQVDVSTVQDGEATAAGGNAGEEGGEGEAGGSNRSAAKRAKKSEKADNFEDAEEDEELRDGKLRFRGGRGEAATYDAGDDEDELAAAQARKETERRGLEALDDDDEDVDDDDERAPGRSAGRDLELGEVRGRKAEGTADDSASLDPDVDYDRHTCSLTVTLPLSSPKLLMLEIVERVAAMTLVRSTPGIEKVYVVEGQGKEQAKVQTDGVNFEGAWIHSDIADVNAVTTNDVYAMLTTFGVEAARATIMREAQSVFSAYGIGVDPRHLSLIADFMTHQGGYRACNRVGIESSVSPFLKMSFETAAHFLTDATLKGAMDDLKSPAARLCVGRVVELGTGCVELVQNIDL
ncbi:hypothetical protein VOLCADRAFT_105949 [Volvox carteri f. nagariensis]|uniref:DNA-directed RNA polymerase subunit n=1 Tax=Volvox carteri f. nagariensis TaxID=3068 RepID=D8U4G0_VOLCA|nr:uncharacterized protein VOLCADRAFT_105949 [Volvox carteri f. nagariensis]EFJ45495.1 hypothetical protein VOLCADRAFT_105949 [Volvox carteri f. nagariensis]|eukprot:XP_002953522.1 hypothetical protein VOLCADRAFT_105949 [Volvox carteri f. nagariensis]